MFLLLYIGLPILERSINQPKNHLTLNKQLGSTTHPFHPHQPTLFQTSVSPKPSLHKPQPAPRSTEPTLPIRNESQAHLTPPTHPKPTLNQPQIQNHLQTNPTLHRCLVKLQKASATGLAKKGRRAKRKRWRIRKNGGRVKKKGGGLKKKGGGLNRKGEGLTQTGKA